MSKREERHYSDRTGWLRAAVLGANDGIVSTASLVVGVAAASSTRGEVLIAGIAGLVAGAMSMAAGEYVSVSSQADTEKADLVRERHELETDAEFEHQELATIYINRGLDPSLAQQVADQLMAHDALAAHARDDWASPKNIALGQFRRPWRPPLHLLLEQPFHSSWHWSVRLHTSPSLLPAALF
jgi:vacuolar iron transporter family protein